MRILKWVAGVLVGLIVPVLVVGLFLPAPFTVARSVEIAAPPEKVYALLGDLRFEPNGTATRVTWTMNGDMGKNPFYHWMALAADGMVGKDFSEGLTGLKAAAEKP